jgi:magnesium-transporting ATPase (P-type)
LTGDKGATAKQIGISCGVLSPDRPIVEIEEFSDLSEELGLGEEKDVLISGVALSAL